ncbi:MAG: hypothetical protein JWP29_27 [Rhodoferax sp.]|nr:hypothetical protein [Rhodoferax sp.]
MKETAPMSYVFENALSPTPGSSALSANQALLDELKWEVDQFLGSGLAERFTVASPNGGLRTEVRDIPAHSLPITHPAFREVASAANQG